MEKLQTSCISGVNIKWGCHCKKNRVAIPKKLNVELLYDGEISLLGIYPKDMKLGTQTNICTLMFIAPLFIIAKMWKLPKCPSIDEWIKMK